MDKKLIKIKDIIKISWNLYVYNFNKFIIPILAVLIISLSSTIFAYFQNINLSVATFITLLIIWLIIIIFISLWANIVLTLIIDKLYKKEQIDNKNIFKLAFHKVPGYLWVNILIFLLIIALFFIMIISLILLSLIFIPVANHFSNIVGLAGNEITMFIATIIITIILMIIAILIILVLTYWFEFALYINVLEKENNKGVKAIKSAYTLVKGRWWAALWKSIIPSLIVSIIVIIAIVALTYILSGGKFDVENSTSSTNLIINSLSSIIFSCLTPLFMTFIIVVYYNLRETKKQA